MAESGRILNVAVVSAERALWTGQAKSLVAKTPEGDIGILPGHEPVLALLVESAPLRVEEPDGSKVLVAVPGGSSIWPNTRAVFSRTPDSVISRKRSLPSRVRSPTPANTDTPLKFSATR